MPLGRVKLIYSREQPLGPTVMGESTSRDLLLATYDQRVGLHIQSRDSPPSFIIGRRGSGKTALLLSCRLDPSVIDVLLSRHNTYQRVQVVVDELSSRMAITEEGVGDIWRVLLWGPVVVRLTKAQDRRDPPGAFAVLWEESAPLRHVFDAAKSLDDDESDMLPDDAVLIEMVERLLETVSNQTSFLGTDTLPRMLQLVRRPWSEVIKAAQEIIGARKANVIVLIDSLENTGGILKQVSPSIRGLFNLVGRLTEALSANLVSHSLLFPERDVA